MRGWLAIISIVAACAALAVAWWALPHVAPQWTWRNSPVSEVALQAGLRLPPHARPPRAWSACDNPLLLRWLAHADPHRRLLAAQACRWALPDAPLLDALTRAAVDDDADIGRESIAALREARPPDLADRLAPLLHGRRAEQVAVAIADVARPDQVARILTVLAEWGPSCTDIWSPGTHEVTTAFAAAAQRLAPPHRAPALLRILDHAWIAHPRLLAATIDGLREVGDAGASAAIVAALEPLGAPIWNTAEVYVALDAWARFAPGETATALAPLLQGDADLQRHARRLLALCGEDGRRALASRGAGQTSG